MSKRLELCWSGKYDRPRVEPRILIRDDARSHGAPSDNMLIHGDNLLALKSLLPKFAGCLNGISSGRFFRDHLAGRYVEDGYGVLYKVHGLGDDTLGFRYFTGPKREGATKGKYYQGVPRDKTDVAKMIRKISIENFYDFAAGFGNCRHEGGVDFRSGKKPEALLQLLLKHFSDEGDLVLDSFLAPDRQRARRACLLSLQNKTRSRRRRQRSGRHHEVCRVDGRRRLRFFRARARANRSRSIRRADHQSELHVRDAVRGGGVARELHACARSERVLEAIARERARMALRHRSIRVDAVARVDCGANVGTGFLDDRVFRA